jgi:hypothetical protein
MAELSPQTQAVARAAASVYWIEEYEVADHRTIAAAALRAAADQVVPDAPIRGGSAFMRGVDERGAEVRRDLLAIAAELEAGG